MRKLLIPIFLVNIIFNASSLEVKKGKGKELKGRVVLGGQVQDTTCDCGTTNNLSQLNKQVKNVTMCNPKKQNIVEIRKGYSSDEHEIMDNEKLQSVIPMDKPEYSPALTKSLKCLDGRIKDNDGVFGFPGGDFGIFMLVLSNYEKIIKRTLMASDIKRIFNSYLEAMPHEKFQMCSDERSVEWLERMMGIEGIDLKSPRNTQIDQILKQINEQHMHGDVLIKTLLKYSGKMKVRNLLVTEFLYVFFNTMWKDKSDKIQLEILQGPHKEAAQIETGSGKECDDAGIYPQVKNTIKFENTEQQFIVNSTQAVFRRIEWMGDFLHDISKEDMDKNKLIKSAKRNAIDWIQMIAHQVAKDLPVFKLSLV